MATKITTLGEQARRQLVDIARDARNAARGTRSDKQRRLIPDHPIVFGVTPASGIPARSGDTISAALCYMYEETVVTATTKTVDQFFVPSGDAWKEYVYNFSETAVAGSVLIGIAYTRDGTLFCIWEDCSTDTWSPQENVYGS